GTPKFTPILQPSLALRLHDYSRSAWHPPGARGDTASIGSGLDIRSQRQLFGMANVLHHFRAPSLLAPKCVARLGQVVGQVAVSHLYISQSDTLEVPVVYKNCH